MLKCNFGLIAQTSVNPNSYRLDVDSFLPMRPTQQCVYILLDGSSSSGADPENLYGRWLAGWLPIVAKPYWCKGRWLINNGGYLLYYAA